jgi:hypothetical protein
MKVGIYLGVAALALSFGGAASAQSTVTTRETVTTRQSAQFSPAQRTVIYKHAMERPRSSTTVVVRTPAPDMAVGGRAPTDADLYDFSEPVLAEVPEAKRYRYMVINNQVLLVDRETSEVVEIIRQ